MTCHAAGHQFNSECMLLGTVLGARMPNRKCAASNSDYLVAPHSCGFTSFW